MAWVRQKLPRVKNKSTTGWLGSSKKLFGSGWVGQNTLRSGQISDRVLTRPSLTTLLYTTYTYVGSNYIHSTYYYERICVPTFFSCN